MKKTLIVLIGMLPSIVLASEVFVKAEIPQSVGNMEEKPHEFHRYGNKLFGYLHYYEGSEGKFALLKFSDGTRSPNTVRATLICKDQSGNPVSGLPIENWMGASEKTMVHRYYYKVNCPGEWGVAWQNHTNYVDIDILKEEALKVVASTVKGWF